jgi:hypothetical protein
MGTFGDTAASGTDCAQSTECDTKHQKSGSRHDSRAFTQAVFSFRISRKRRDLLVLAKQGGTVPSINLPLKKTCKSSSQIARSRQLVHVALSGSPPVLHTKVPKTFLSTPKVKEV